MIKDKISYFEFQAEIGVTKHIGGVRATDELMELCHIKKGSYVLEVGCGVGLTTAYLAKKGCKVVGIDLSEKMIEKAREKAKRKGLEDKIEFLVADAQKLPFKDNTFDAVISESVYVFIPDRKKAMKEFNRVIKKGGYVGITEVSWIKEPPPELRKQIRDFVQSDIPSTDEWKKLLKDAGLKEIVGRTYKLNMKDEFFDQIRRWDIVEYLRVLGLFLKGMIQKPSYRRFIMDSLKLSPRLIKYWGWGVYSGKKRIK